MIIVHVALIYLSLIKASTGLKCFGVEKKTFLISFQGIHGGPWISVMKRNQGHAFSITFEEEEVAWIFK